MIASPAPSGLQRPGRRSWLGHLLAIAAMASIGTQACARAETPDSDPRALAVADRVMKALGGQSRWDKVAGLRWTWVSSVNDTVRSSRRHAWDKRTGWTRVEGRNRQGQNFAFVASLDKSEGMARMDGQMIEGDSLQKLLKRARSLWNNDAYWLLMPYKLRDPGVRLKYEGEVELEGKRYDKVAMAFENVGDTPGDRYWIYVNKAGNRIERWEHLLEGDEPPSQMWSLEGYEQHDGLWFATVHKSGTTTIYTRDIEMVSSFPPEVFAAP